MVPAQKILDTAREHNADIVGLSGPHHAVARGDGARRARDAAPRHDAAAADRRRDDVARAHGGEDRAELRRASPSTCPTRRARSAWRATCCPTSCEARYVAEVAADYEKIRVQHASKKGPTLIPLAAARANAFRADWAHYAPPVPTCARPARVPQRRSRASSRSASTGGRSSRRGSSPGRIPAILDDPVVGEAARSVYAEGQAMLQRHRRRAAGSPRTASSRCCRRTPSATTSSSTPTSRARRSR